MGDGVALNKHSQESGRLIIKKFNFLMIKNKMKKEQNCHSNVTFLAIS